MRLRPKNPTLSVRPDLQEWLIAMAKALAWFVRGNRPTRTARGIEPDAELRPAVSATLQAALAYVAMIDRGARAETSKEALGLGLAELRRREAVEGADKRTCIRISC